MVMGDWVVADGGRCRVGWLNRVGDDGARTLCRTVWTPHNEIWMMLLSYIVYTQRRVCVLSGWWWDGIYLPIIECVVNRTAVPLTIIIKLNLLLQIYLFIYFFSKLYCVLI